ncbi:MAG: isoleucine--tRNA ligase [Clostridia bacterium]
MEYDKTLNLPQTEFPMRGNLPKMEPSVLEFWEKENIYTHIQKANAGKAKFILHDGPPYANGNIHLGTTLNKILKDIIIKYKSMNGFDAPYIPGWDTHGLPIEIQAIKNLKIDRSTVDVVDFRNQCADYARKFVDVQKSSFKRLGVRGDWENPYLTLNPEFEAAQIGVFGEMAEKGYIYKGLKPVYWCSDCETALAEAEVEYQNKKSASIFVKFPVKDSKKLFDIKNTYVLIWTTTPWTLPANVAISLHPNFTYVLARVGEEKYLVAKELIDSVAEECHFFVDEIMMEFQGADLEYMVCENPLLNRDSLVIVGEHVTIDAGTGCVHTAPGHGADDFIACQKYKLPIISPVNNKGIFTEEGQQFAGMSTQGANKAIIQQLEDNGLLLKTSMIEHQYPHCWRCKKPIIYRATEQWFVSIDGFRKIALEAIQNDVVWIPAWGKERIHSMIADRGDWCISRQRKWGVPIPIFYCSKCNEAIITHETIAKLQDIFKIEGSNAWYAREVSELMPLEFKCPKCGNQHFTRESDIMDVWFDSGSSHAAVLDINPQLAFPADLYLEGSDQHRGWFNSSLCTAIATKGKAPYKSVLTHGYVVDNRGRKQSKSLGNGIDPLAVIQKMGADILRLWVASSDYRKDIACGDDILKQMTETYRKLRNTSRFLLSCIPDFNPVKDEIVYADLCEIDQWALLRLNGLIDKVTTAYENYDFHIVYHGIHNFCVVDLSSIYLDIIKDRLYCSATESKERKSAQTAIYEIIYNMNLLLVPILAYTTEEIWNYLPSKEKKQISVQLAAWPKVQLAYQNNQLAEKWDSLISIREDVAKILEVARQNKIIGNSLEAKIVFYASGKTKKLLEDEFNNLPTYLIVSQVSVEDFDKAPDATAEITAELKILALTADGQKCERCWNYSVFVGQDSEHPTLCQRCLGVINNNS